MRNRRGERLTQHGARYLMRKYLALAQKKMPSLRRPGISPHTLRHYVPFLTMSRSTTPASCLLEHARGV
jgi:site-specific recombinase XerD